MCCCNAGHDVKSTWVFQASGISLLHDVDEWQSDTSVQHHDVSDWHLPAIVNSLQRQSRYDYDFALLFSTKRSLASCSRSTPDMAMIQMDAWFQSACFPQSTCCPFAKKSPFAKKCQLTLPIICSYPSRPNRSAGAAETTAGLLRNTDSWAGFCLEQASGHGPAANKSV